MKPVGVGVVGLGLMGRVHLQAYQAARASGFPCRVVAACDRNRDRLDGRASRGGNLQSDAEGERLFDPREVETTTDPAVVFAREEIQLVSICTPTDSHVDLAAAALRAGKHVVVEKPVALDPRAIERLAAVASESRRFCLPAMCMRFWPGWSWLLDAARERRYGAITGASFQRQGSRPTWGEGFYADAARSGGALFDLHVHDVDFVRALLGEPVAVHAHGTLDHVTTHYRYPGLARRVSAEGGWDHAPGFPFRMRYVVDFERATAEYDSRRGKPLEITLGGRTQAVDTDDGTGYDPEIRHALECASEGRLETAVGLRDAERVTRILLAEKESLELNIERVVP